MAENANVEMLRARYAAWHDCKGTDPDVWLSIVADDFHLHSLCGGAPGVEFTATCTCKEEAAGYLSALSKDWEMQFYRIDEYIADGDRVVAIGRCAWTNRANGKPVDTPKVDIWRFRDGQAVEFSEFYDSAGLLAAAG